MAVKTCTWIDLEDLPARLIAEPCGRPARYPGYRDVWTEPLCQRDWRRFRAIHEAPCVVAGCTNEAKRRGYCRPHEGEPLRAMSAGERERLELALVERIKPRGRAGCWMWTGRQNGDGYGLFDVPGDGGAWLAHRLIWNLFYAGHENGEWDNPVELDHLCTHQELSRYDYGGRLCVNPLHLRPATMRANRALRQIRAARPFVAWHAQSRESPRPLSLVPFAMRHGLPMDPQDRYVAL